MKALCKCCYHCKKQACSFVFLIGLCIYFNLLYLNNSNGFGHKGAKHRPNIATKGINFFMIFFVKSACPRFTDRKHIRATYASISSINGRRFAFVFLIGNSTARCQHNLAQEISEFGDILQADVADEYEALPEKVLAAYQWIHYNVQNISAFYSFTDDDCFINILNVYQHFESNFLNLMESENVFCGFHFTDPESPSRDAESKYYTSPEIYSNSRFPAFCNGGLTTMSFPILRDIYLMAEVTNRNGLSLEDVYITGILRAKLGRGSSNIARLDYRPATNYDELVIHLGNNPNAKIATTIFWANQLYQMQITSDKVLMSNGYFADDFLFTGTNGRQLPVG